MIVIQAEKIDFLETDILNSLSNKIQCAYHLF